MSQSKRRCVCFLSPVGLTVSPKAQERFQQKSPHWALKFILDKHLTLNLTFLYIYISSTSINKCNYARFEVQMASSRALTREHLHCSLPLLDKVAQVQVPVTFCGIHSQKTVLSSSHVTYFAACLKPFVLNTTFIAYSILDKHHIETLDYPKHIFSPYNGQTSFLRQEQGMMSQTKMQMSIFRLMYTKCSRELSEHQESLRTTCSFMMDQEPSHPKSRPNIFSTIEFNTLDQLFNALFTNT